MPETFTVRGMTYELSEELKQHFIDKVEASGETLAAFFDGSTFIHKYRNEDGVEETAVDVVEVFETYPSEAEQVLDSVGLNPMKRQTHIESGLVSLDNWR